MCLDVSEFVSCITMFYLYRGGIAYFKCIEINKASLSKLRVSLEYLFAECRGRVSWFLDKIKIWSP